VSKAREIGEAAAAAIKALGFGHTLDARHAQLTAKYALLGAPP